MSAQVSQHPLSREFSQLKRSGIHDLALGLIVGYYFSTSKLSRLASAYSHNLNIHPVISVIIDRLLLVMASMLDGQPLCRGCQTLTFVALCDGFTHPMTHSGKSYQVKDVSYVG